MSSLQTNPAEIWAIAKNELKNKLSADIFTEWFEKISFSKFEENTFYLLGTDFFIKSWVTTNYSDVIEEALAHACGSNVNFSIDAPEDVEEVANQNVSTHVPVAKPVPATPHRELDPAIRRQNTFESFVKGAENEMAVAAAMGLAESLDDPDGINPLFIFGSTGLGKTHLMHAIANRIFQKKSDARICYVTCETFTNEFLAALSQSKIHEFRRRYRDMNPNLLLVDDIQFLAGKTQTQEEFFHTFNQLCINGCKIVLTSDRPANEIKIEDRLISRFQQGISADIKPPCLETRLAILMKKAEARGFDFARFPGILEFVAQNITRSVRNLEGAVNTLSSYVALKSSVVLTIPEVEGILSGFLRQEESVKITAEFIQKRVAEFYKIDVQKMTAKGRTANIAFARQVAMYLCSELTDMKLVSIGDAFGGRDHGTVIHAKRTVQNRIDTSAHDKQDVENLRDRICRERG